MERCRLLRVLVPCLAGGALALLAGRAGVRAGDYHDGVSLDCSDCHVMHLAQPVASAVTPAVLDPAVAGPLLRSDVNDLCLSCHDGSLRAADVLGINQGRAPSDVRQAGFLNRAGRSGDASTGHTLDSLEVAPGSSPPWSAELENGPGHGLNCVNCHAPHGRQGAVPAYRNLRSDAGVNPLGRGLVTCNDGPAGVNDPSRDVFVRQARSYDESAVDFNEPDPRDSAMARYCAGCHGGFHGEPGVGSAIGGHQVGGGGLAGFVRHPASGVDIGDLGGEWSSRAQFASNLNRVKVMSSLGDWSAGGADLTPTCISCHKAHGNSNPFGLIFRSGSGTLTEDGDSGGHNQEALCRQCHTASTVLP